MSGDRSDESERNDLEQARRIHCACEAFEARWQDSDRPRIEDVLDGAKPSDRGALLEELLILEIELRRAAGERPTLSEYWRDSPRPMDESRSRSPRPPAHRVRRARPSPYREGPSGRPARTPRRSTPSSGSSAIMRSLKKSLVGAWGLCTRPGSGEQTAWSHSK